MSKSKEYAWPFYGTWCVMFPEELDYSQKRLEAFAEGEPLYKSWDKRLRDRIVSDSDFADNYIIPYKEDISYKAFVEASRFILYRRHKGKTMQCEGYFSGECKEISVNKLGFEYYVSVYKKMVRGEW